METAEEYSGLQGDILMAKQPIESNFTYCSMSSNCLVVVSVPRSTIIMSENMWAKECISLTPTD